TMQQDGHANAHRQSLNGSDDGLLRISHRMDEANGRRHRLPSPGLLQKIKQVVAAGKRLANRVQQDHAYGRIGLCLLHCSGKCAIHLRSQRVLFLGTVDGDALHRAIKLALNMAHGLVLTAIPANIYGRYGSYRIATALTACPRRSFAALTVLLISMAMVSGPTPPGTGVMAPATSATLGCTSPIRVEPLAAKSRSRFSLPAKNFWNSAGSVTVFMPTSMTVAPGFTNSGVIMPALPIAATRM